MEEIIKEYNKLQQIYGSKDLNSVYGYGCLNPDIALVFMNPTKRNVATAKDWQGIRAQWLGTKQIWQFINLCGLIDSDINQKIQAKTRKDWTAQFCEEVYANVLKHKVWITNLAKCSQDDARPLPDSVFEQYKSLLIKELNELKPKIVLLFGNQVSSILLETPIAVSQNRGKQYKLKIGNSFTPTYAVYYPVGNGRFNQPKAVEDIKHILIKEGLC